MTLRKLTLEDVEIELIAEPEDMPIRGNAIASGNRAYDRKVEKKLQEKLEYNEWAWCVAHVVVRWHELEGNAYLGGCSYESAEDFKASYFLVDGTPAEGYYQEMVREALQDLQRQVETLAKQIGELAERKS